MAFEVDDLQAAVDRVAADGNGLVGGIGQYEDIWRTAYVRGPEGIMCRQPSGSADATVNRKTRLLMRVLPKLPSDCRFSLSGRPECRTLTATQAVASPWWLNWSIRAGVRPYAASSWCWCP